MEAIFNSVSAELHDGIRVETANGERKATEVVVDWCQYHVPVV